VQDRLRFKNLLKSSYERLVADGMRTVDTDALLAPAQSLLDNEAFWLRIGDGLALFISPDGLTYYRADAYMPEQVVIGDRFYIRPLATACCDRRFYALAFDRNRARLFVGDQHDISEIPIENAPTSLSDETKYDTAQESLQFTTFAGPQSSAGVGQAIGMFHGHGGENVDKTQLARYANSLEKAVTREIGSGDALPLVLLGVDYQLVAYRAANTYPVLFPEQIAGAVDELTDKQIQGKVLDTLAARLHGEVEADLIELRESPSTLVSDDPVEIALAAASGRVKTIFVDDSVGPFGHLDRQLGAVREVCTAAPRYLRDSADAELPEADCGWDLGDLAVAETILRGGTVHAFTGEGAPVSGVAAVFRY
jgi:hypothetical protein